MSTSKAQVSPLPDTRGRDHRRGEIPGVVSSAERMFLAVRLLGPAHPVIVASIPVVAELLAR